MEILADAPHTHASDLEACLDLVNTIELTDGIPDERLPAVDDAVAFLVDHDLGHADELRSQARSDPAAWLARLHCARAAVRETWDALVAGQSPSAAALSTINELLVHAPRLELRPALTGVVVTHRHAKEDPLGESLARAVEPLAAAIATGRTDRFRVCANDGCRWVFQDSSRGGRRRWCDMGTCGNRAKVRRYRSRQRDVPGEAPGS